jgi:hypothetical protein
MRHKQTKEEETLGQVMPLFVEQKRSTPKKETCSECGSPFVPKNLRHKTCCVDCSVIRKNRKLKEDRRKRAEQVKLARQRIAKNKKIEEREDIWDIIVFYEEGNSLKQTALKFKSTRDTIKRILSDHKIKIRGCEFYNHEKDKTTDQIRKAAIQEYISTNITRKGLTKKYNLSKERAHQLTIGLKKMFGFNSGYKTLPKPGHPRSSSSGKVLEHILVAETKMQRPIGRDEQIHHVDFDKHNNKPNNLAVGSPKQHGFWHRTHAEVMSILMPILIGFGFVTFSENDGYDLDPKNFKKLKKNLKKA